MKRAKSQMENKVKYGTISLPLPLINKIRKKIARTGVNSVSSYVAFVLREVMSYKGGIADKRNRKEIKERLKRLGYLD